MSEFATNAILPPPPPAGAIALHDRENRVRAFRLAADRLLVQGAVRDQKPPRLYLRADPDPLTVHHMIVSLEVSFPDLVIADVVTHIETHPRDECPTIESHYGNLVGIAIARGFTHRVRDLFGGPRGCTHTTELLQAMAPVAVQCFWSMHAAEAQLAGLPEPLPDPNRHDDPAAWRRTIDTCHVWSADGPVVAERAPHHTASADNPKPHAHCFNTPERSSQHAQRCRTHSNDQRRVPQDPIGGSRLNSIVGPQASDLRTFGLAALVTAGPKLESKLSSRRHRLGGDECPEGVDAFVVVCNWARCGRTDPIPTDAFRVLWNEQVGRRRGRSSDEAFTNAIGWAIKPVGGGIALIYERDGCHIANDFTVRLLNERGNLAVPTDETWAAAATTAPAEQAFAVGVAAHSRVRLSAALSAWDFSAAVPTLVTSMALFNKGVTLGALGRSDEAIAVYDDVVDRYEDDPTPALRDVVDAASRT